MHFRTWVRSTLSSFTTSRQRSRLGAAVTLSRHISSSLGESNPIKYNFCDVKLEDVDSGPFEMTTIRADQARKRRRSASEIPVHELLDVCPSLRFYVQDPEVYRMRD